LSDTIIKNSTGKNITFYKYIIEYNRILIANKNQKITITSKQR